MFDDKTTLKYNITHSPIYTASASGMGSNSVGLSFGGSTNVLSILNSQPVHPAADSSAADDSTAWWCCRSGMLCNDVTSTVMVVTLRTLASPRRGITGAVL